MNTESTDYIQFEGLGKSFGNQKKQPQRVFSNFNLSIHKGQFVSIIGPSGCGKSTLLRLMSGLLPYEEGEIRIGGTRVKQTVQGISFVFQTPALIPWLNIRKNILFPFKHKNGRISEYQKACAEKLIQLTGLESHAEKRPHQLSGGMQQRVAIARALVQESEILLMDEPFSALDAMNREKLGFELLDMLKGQHKTVLFVTHSIPEAVLLSDKIVILESDPAQIAEVIDIEFSEARSLSTLSDPVFGRYCQEVRAHFYQTKTEGKV